MVSCNLPFVHHGMCTSQLFSYVWTKYKDEVPDMSGSTNSSQQKHKDLSFKSTDKLTKK